MVIILKGRGELQILGIVPYPSLPHILRSQFSAFSTTFSAKLLADFFFNLTPLKFFSKKRKTVIRPPLFSNIYLKNYLIHLTRYKAYLSPPRTSDIQDVQEIRTSHNRRRTSLPAVLQPLGMTILMDISVFMELNVIIDDLLQLHGFSQPAFLSLKRIKKLLVRLFKQKKST